MRSSASECCKRSPILLVEVRVMFMPFILALAMAGGDAHAWDPAGHGMAALLGASLMRESPVKKLLLTHELLFSSAAAFPDVPFRKQSTEITGYEAEAPNHFFHLDDPKV